MSGREVPDRRGDPLRISDIERAAFMLEEIRKLGKDRFLSDPIVQDAAIRRLEIIGEAAGRVSAKVRESNPNVPWSRMWGFASIAKHEYWRVNVGRVWAAVEAMPGIQRRVAQVRAAPASRE